MDRSPGAKAARRAFVLQGRFRRFFSNLGPGLITGAADDDPSGISTYSVTGAAFGYTPLWTALFSFPLMAAVQIMCARLGIVTGRGLAGVIRVRYPRWILWSACALLIVANIVNIAADLGGMAGVTELLTGVRSLYWTPVYALVLVGLAMHQVHVTGERLRRPDRDMKRRDLLSEGRPERVDRVAGAGVLAVALVDEDEGRPTIRTGHRHRRLEAGLHVPGRIHQQHGSVRGGEALDDLCRKVRVPGGVDDLNSRSLVIQVRHGQGERLLALLLLGLEVQARRAVIDAS